MFVRREQTFSSIFLACGIVLCIFLIRSIYKPIEAYSKEIAHNDSNNPGPHVSPKTEVTEKDPNSAQVHINQADLYYAKGQYDQAVCEYTKAIEINPQDAMAWYSRGNAYRVKCQYDQAISDYNKALVIKPRLMEAFYYQAIAQAATGRQDEAISGFTKALEISPRLVEAYYNRGKLYAVKGQFDKAIVDFDKALKIIPQYEIAYEHLKNAYKAKAEADAKAMAEAKLQQQAELHDAAIKELKQKLIAQTEERTKVEAQLQAQAQVYSASEEQLGDNRAIDPLVKTLEDENQGVRTVAAGALESIRSKTVMKILSTASNVERAGFIPELFIDKKVYLGAVLSFFLPFVGLTIVYIKRRRRISAQI